MLPTYAPDSGLIVGLAVVMALAWAALALFMNRAAITPPKDFHAEGEANAAEHVLSFQRALEPAVAEPSLSPMRHYTAAKGAAPAGDAALTTALLGGGGVEPHASSLHAPSDTMPHVSSLVAHDSGYFSPVRGAPLVGSASAARGRRAYLASQQAAAAGRMQSLGLADDEASALWAAPPGDVAPPPMRNPFARPAARPPSSNASQRPSTSGYAVAAAAGSGVAVSVEPSWLSLDAPPARGPADDDIDPAL